MPASPKSRIHRDFIRAFAARDVASSTTTQHHEIRLRENPPTTEAPTGIGIGQHAVPRESRLAGLAERAPTERGAVRTSHTRLPTSD